MTSCASTPSGPRLSRVRVYRLLDRAGADPAEPDESWTSIGSEESLSDHASATQSIEVRIDRLSSDGDGVGRASDGLTVFVPFSAPGDRLRVRIVERRRRFLRGEIDEILSRGPLRVEPRCGAFGRCGGCAWQHIDYAAQLEAKRTILGDALRRIGGHRLESPPDVMASPAPYGYRSRARVLSRAADVGYRAPRSHALCAVTQCPVLAPSLESSLARVSAASPHDGKLREWEIAIGTDARARIHEIGAEPAADPADELALDVAGDRISLSPGAFAQVNALLRDALHARVVERAGEGGRLLELYAGAGFFTLALSRRFASVEAVESSPVSGPDLVRNLARAGRSNVTVLHSRVEAVVPRQVRSDPDVVVLDPPRSGLPEIVTTDLARLAARRIVYVSCDPATLARDTARLVASGYALTHVEGFDLFPQTPHVEALAVLERRVPGS